MNWNRMQQIGFLCLWLCVVLFVVCSVLRAVGCVCPLQVQPKTCAVHTLAQCTHWLAKTDSITIYFNIISLYAKT